MNSQNHYHIHIWPKGLDSDAICCIAVFGSCCIAFCIFMMSVSGAFTKDVKEPQKVEQHATPNPKN